MTHIVVEFATANRKWQIMLVSHTVDFIRHLPKVAVLVNLASIGFWGRMAEYVSSYIAFVLLSSWP